MIIDRREMREQIASLISHLQKRPKYKPSL